MKLLFSLLLLLSLVMIPNAFAETKDQNVFVDFNPVPLAQKGVGFTAGIRHKYFRFASFIVEKEDSSYINEGNGIKSEVREIGGWLGIGTKDGHGFLGALELRRSRVLLTKSGTTAVNRRDTDFMGIKIAYQHFFNKTFFVRPEVGSLRNISNKRSIELDGEGNEVKDQYFVWGLNLGARF